MKNKYTCLSCESPMKRNMGTIFKCTRCSFMYQEHALKLHRMTRKVRNVRLDD